MKMVDVYLPLVSVILIYLSRMIELGTRRDTMAGPVLERLTLPLFVLAGSVMVAGSIVELFVRHLRLNGWTFVCGWMCAVASVVLRRKAIAALGRFWSLHVEIREGHQFVRTGPFRWMRHPTYFSMILELLAIGLVTNALYTAVVVAVLFVPTLAFRINLEETALVARFGEMYKQYQRTTPALFPYKWPREK